MDRKVQFQDLSQTVSVTEEFINPALLHVQQPAPVTQNVSASQLPPETDPPIPKMANGCDEKDPMLKMEPVIQHMLGQSTESIAFRFGRGLADGMSDGIKTIVQTGLEKRGQISPNMEQQLAEHLKNYGTKQINHCLDKVLEDVKHEWIRGFIEVTSRFASSDVASRLDRQQWTASSLRACFQDAIFVNGSLEACVGHDHHQHDDCPVMRACRCSREAARASRNAFNASNPLAPDLVDPDPVFPPQKDPFNCCWGRFDDTSEPATKHEEAAQKHLFAEEQHANAIREMLLRAPDVGVLHARLSLYHQSVAELLSRKAR